MLFTLMKGIKGAFLKIIKVTGVWDFCEETQIDFMNVLLLKIASLTELHLR